jgi:hypothetical protein
MSSNESRAVLSLPVRFRELRAAFPAALLCSLGWLAAAAAPGAAAPLAPAVAQEPEETPPPDERPEIAERLEQLADLLKDRKGERDEEAIGLVDQLLSEFEASGPKDREAIVEGVGECLEVRRNPSEDGTPNQALQRAAAVALGRMGPESAAVLVAHVDHKALREAEEAHADVLRSVGRVQAPKGVKPLLEMLGHDSFVLQGAAAQALGSYVDAEQKVRKDIFEQLLKTIIPLQDTLDTGDQASADYEETRKRYDAISTSIAGAMEALTGQQAGDFRAWNRWWNDHKKDDWDAGRPAAG